VAVDEFARTTPGKLFFGVIALAGPGSCEASNTGYRSW